MMSGNNSGNPVMQLMGQMMNMLGNPGGCSGMGGMGETAGRVMGGPKTRIGDWYCQQCGDHQFAKNIECRQCGAARPMDGSENLPPDSRMFLAAHEGLEEHAVEKFLSCDEETQTAVIKRGSLQGARDQTAVLLARIRECGGGGKGVASPGALDWYCPNCYDLQFKNNDICRICGTDRAFGVKDITQLDPENFLTGHDIEAERVIEFNSLSTDMKKTVMSGGSLHGARDPTAVLVNRMSKARAGMSGGFVGQGGKALGFPADWFCQQCGDHQFARNAMCRNCGAPKPTDGSQFNTPDPLLFLANHQVEDHAKEKFLSLDPDSQAAIVLRGSLAGARDPTAVLLARMKELSNGGSGAKPMHKNLMQSMRMSGGCGGGNPQEQMMQMMMQQMMAMQQQMAMQQTMQGRQQRGPGRGGLR